MMVFFVLMLAVLLIICALVIDMGTHYSLKASLQILADSAALESLASVDPVLTHDQEDAAIRTFVTNITEANGRPAALFRVKTYACDASGRACGYAMTDLGHTSTLSTELINCPALSRAPSLQAEELLSPAGPLSWERMAERADPGDAAVALATLGTASVRRVPTWMQPGALNLAGLFDGVGNTGVASGHAGYGVPATIAQPTNGDVCRVEVSTTVDSPSFFASLVNLSIFKIGIFAAAQRNYNTQAPVARNCAFYGQNDVWIHGNSANAIDSYDSRLGTTYFSQRTHTDVAGQAYAREMAVGCSDGAFRYNGNINHHGGSSAVGDITISGNSFDIFGNLLTATNTDPTGFTSNIHATTYPAGTGTIQKNANVAPLNLPPVDFTEACLLPRIFAYCAATNPVQSHNDNSGHITGYFNSSQLSTNKVLTNSTGSGPATACDGSSNRKTICLDAGYTYYFKGIDIGNTTDLSIRGTSAYKTIIYLDADSCGRMFKIRGQTRFGTSSDAANVLFYAGSSTLNLPADCPTGPEMSIGGAGTFVGDLYAPAFDLKIGGGGGPDNGDFYGRIHSKSIEIGGNQSFHYDEAIGPLASSGASVAVVTKVILVE